MTALTCAACSAPLAAAPEGRVVCLTDGCPQTRLACYPPETCAACGRQATGQLLFPVGAPVLCGRADCRAEREEQR
jgi:hypothetical protein